MSDDHVTSAASVGSNETSGRSGPSGDELLLQIGRDFVQNGIYAQANQGVIDRTGHLMQAAHEISSELRRARVISIEEPVTGEQGIAVLGGDGGITALPSHVFDEYRATPKRRSGTAAMTRIDSFIDHANRFKTEESALFAHDDMAFPRLVAVLDYHDRVNVHGELAAPQFGVHRTTFAFPLSEEWKAWTKANGEKMTQGDFAQFLEDRFVDVEHVENIGDLNDDIRKLIDTVGRTALATPSKLIELSRGLAVHEKSAVVETRNLASGEGEVRFQSEHVDAAGAPVNIPSLFVIVIPVFARDEPWRIAARLRYRKTPGGLVFWFELWGEDRVFEQAFTELCQRAQQETDLPLFFGKPE